MKNVITSRLSGFLGNSSWRVWRPAKDSSSWKVVVQELAVYKKRNTTDAGLKHSSMTLSHSGKRAMCRLGGFTLIELLVVVLIIGILAAIAVPQYQKAVLKARASEALLQGKALLSAEKAYVLSNGVMTADLDSLDITLPENARWTCAADSSYCVASHLTAYGLYYEINTYFGNKPSLWCGAKNGLPHQICASQGEFHHTVNDFDYYLILK